MKNVVCSNFLIKSRKCFAEWNTIHRRQHMPSAFGNYAHIQCIRRKLSNATLSAIYARRDDTCWDGICPFETEPICQFYFMSPLRIVAYFLAKNQFSQQNNVLNIPHGKCSLLKSRNGLKISRWSSWPLCHSLSPLTLMFQDRTDHLVKRTLPRIAFKVPKLAASDISRSVSGPN